MTESPHIPPYLEFLGSPMLAALEERAVPVGGVPGLRVDPVLLERFPNIETPEALAFVCNVYRQTYRTLRDLLEQRTRDRALIDSCTAGFVAQNADLPFDSPDYGTPIGLVDDEGRRVIGPYPDRRTEWSKVSVPKFLQGEQVTLFGPPDSAKLSINAMNALHRKPDGEPAIVTRLVEESGEVPRWGADNEDSKTPIMANFLHACENLIGCFDRTLRFEDDRKVYELADSGLARPIKRFPGLALPDGNHLLDGNPLPLHLYDLAMHMFWNWDKPEALVFYVPKLENEEEAAYVRELVSVTERAIASLHPEYEVGQVRLFVVFENPRAIFRIREMAEALHPYFVGGSLGWHDFLASTARIFRHDPRYRIPVKADPNIVINHIRESHEILVRELDPIGGVKIGGMYGVLYEAGNPASYEVSMVGYIKDVVTQLDRGLDGFWVAHPDFVRPGLALVAAYRQGRETLRELVRALVPSESELGPLLEFLDAPDVPGLEEDDPRYQRGVLAADVEMSDVIANDDPEEVRYNVFQALQYLADWLAGNGCVALPATMTNASGDVVTVRVMDDLATTERSRWELWAEVAHGRVSEETFEAILQEEIAFLKEGVDTATKRIAVPWESAERWYPIAERLLRQLVTTDSPPEFATELLMPFTFDLVRESADPWKTAVALNPGRFSPA